MDRRTLIALSICFLIMLFYPRFLSWLYPPLPGQAEPGLVSVSNQQSLPPKSSVAKEPSSLSPVPSNPPKDQLKPQYEVPEEEFVVENNQTRVVFSNWGGVIKEIGLKYFHDKSGEMIRLDPGAREGWRTLQILLSPGQDADRVFNGGIEGRKIVFENAATSGLTLRKTYVFAESGYQINATLEIENKSDQEMSFEDGMGISMGSIFGHELKEGLTDVSIAALDSLGNVWRRGISRIKERSTQTTSFRWAGLQNQYYAIIVRPEAEVQGLLFSPIKNSAAKAEGCQAALCYGKFKISSGKSLKQTFLIYGGPKEFFALQKFPDQFERIIDFGMFGPIAKGILYLLHYLYVPFHSYGISIILLTVLVKLITYPLTAKSFKSMKEMQALQPHISLLKEKHKNNPKKIQKEMMELYKEHKVNPMGGCLPMLIQLPIFVALFNALRNAIELKGSSFLWMRDLSLPDTVGVVAGLPINILPIIMGGTMVWQQKMSTVDPQQAKMMMFMPIFFTFIFYSFPSGLVLYWLVNNVLSIAQQYQVQMKKA